MKRQQEYWDKKIKIWSNSSYGREGSGFNLIEWLAGFFRGPITARLEVALKVIGPKTEGKIIADFGCGIGDFCFKILAFHPQKVIGFDISTVAIETARQRAKEKVIDKKVTFIQSDVGGLTELPRFDLAVGLGFIDYLNKEELIHLFKLLKGKYFFFSFPEKKLSLINFLQTIYLKIQRCPGAYKYSREEMKEMLPRNMDYRFVEKDKMVFITDL